MYSWLQIKDPGDFHTLRKLLPVSYDPEAVSTLLERHVSKQCAGVLVEFMYVDKDYRSTYYNFYAKKGLRYSPFCVRLHFFDSCVEFDADTLTLSATPRDVAAHYFGFMVLRPTTVYTIGRTVLSTRLLEGFAGQIAGAWHKVHVLGISLKVWGFPWMFQHRDIAVCAHVACWAILRHYSERYSLYAEHLTHDISKMAYGFDPGGLIPSRGLTLLHAERVFSAARTYPVMVVKANDDKGSFYRSMLAYIESGFPLFAALPDKRHAIAIVGHGPMQDKLPSGKDTKPLYYASDFIDGLIAIDDNHAPYRSIGSTVQLPLDYTVDSIKAFVVPLPDKVFYPAESVEKYALKLTESGYFGVGIPPDETPVIRYFLTTAAAFRRFIAGGRSEFPAPLVAAALQLPLTQFLWVIEVATEEQWQHHHVRFRAILDATASLMDRNPLFFIHNDVRAVVIDRLNGGLPQELVFAAPVSVPFGRMPDDLYERNDHGT